MVGEAIQLARHRKGWTQGQLASRLLTHPRNIGHWENGTDGRCPDLSALVRMVNLFDDAGFTLAVIRHITGGLFGMTAVALNGVRTAATIAMGIELEELRSDLARAQGTLIRDPAMAERETVESVWLNLMDVHVTVNQMLVELSRDYDLSVRQMSAKHADRLRQKGYIKQSHPRERVA